MREVLANRLRQGEGLPGFGHPLYPQGDPRAALLLSFANRLGRGAVLELIHGWVEVARDITGEHPTVDFALVALARALGLPAGSPLALLCLGRTLGWIAHAIEQYADARLIRPRARYIGPRPEGGRYGCRECCFRCTQSFPSAISLRFRSMIAAPSSGIISS